MNRQTSEPLVLWWVIDEAPSLAGLYLRPGYTAGYIPDNPLDKNVVATFVSHCMITECVLASELVQVAT